MPTPTTPPTATWNPARGAWEKTDLTGLCGHSELFSETWPTSGTTRAGSFYARPMWAHLTHEPASSSSPGLLPTPNAADGMGGPGHQGRAGGLNLRTAAAELLPTPAASVANDGEDTENWLARRDRVKATGVNGNGMGMPLTIAVQLLPTPQAHDAMSPKTPEQIAAMRARGFGVSNLNEVVTEFLPGTLEFIPGRAAEPPAKPGNDSRPSSTDGSA